MAEQRSHFRTNKILTSLVPGEQTSPWDETTEMMQRKVLVGVLTSIGELNWRV